MDDNHWGLMNHKQKSHLLVIEPKENILGMDRSILSFYSGDRTEDDDDGTQN